MKEPIFLALLFVFSLRAFAYESITTLKVSDNGTIQWYERETNQKEDMNQPKNRKRMFSQHLSTDMNNLIRNKRDTPCIPGEESSSDSVNFSMLNNNNSSNTVSSIMNNLNQGTANIKYSNDPNIILLLGLSGTGKSTLVQYLFGNNANLRSVAKRNSWCEATGDFYIEDTGKKIGHNSLLSHTELPNLVIDPETKTTIYDCPGFSDTRDPEHDISGAYFIKAVSDKAKALKFIFVVNYISVTIGANREEFMTLARHATNMINNISKYRESIALVATKIRDNKTDKQRIIAITDFLQDVRRSLKTTNKEPNIQLFIDILLTTSGPNSRDYTRISFMPKLSTEGRLIDLPLFQAHKQSLLTIIHNNIKFTKIDATDVKPTISSNSVYYIDGLVNEVSQQMWFHIKNIAEKIQVFNNNLIQNMQHTIHSLNNEKIAIDTDRSKAVLFSSEISRRLSVISEFVKNIKSKTTLSELSKYIISSPIISEVNLSQDIVSNISTRHEYLKFLLTVHKPKHSFPVEGIITLFKNVENQLMISTNHFYNHVSNVTDQIENEILLIDNNIMNEIQKKYSSITETVLDNTKMSSLMNAGYSELLEIRDSANRPEITYKCIDQIQRILKHFNFTATNIKSVNRILEYISKLVDYLNFLQTLKNQSANRNTLKCTDKINRVLSYLYDSSKWYISLNRLSQSLSKCDILKNFSPYEISNMISEHDSDKRLEETDIKFFLKKFYSPSTYDLEYNHLKNVKLDPSKFESLRKISNFIFGYQLTHGDCSSDNSTTNNNSNLFGDLYTTEGLINELLAIEYQFYELHNKISFKTIYKSFVNRVSQYLKKIKTKPEHGENIKALQYLYAIAASKLYRLNHNFDETSIELNIIQYFTIVEEHIREYDKALKEVNINKHEQEYSRKIYATVKEANNFIENDLQSAIDESIEKVDENIDMLINEVTTKREEVQNEIKSLEKTKSMLEGQLILKALFGTLQFVGAGLAILGPIGAAVGSVAAVGGAVATSLLPDVQGTLPVLLPASVSKNIPKIVEHLRNKGKILEKKLYLAQHEIENHMKKDDANELKILKKKINECSLEILKINSNDKKILDANDLKKLTKLEKDMTNLVENEKNALNNKLSTVKAEYSDEIKKYNHYNAESLDKLHNLYKQINKLKADGEKLNRKGEEITQLQKQIDTIENNHKSAKLEANELEKKRISILEEYSKERRNNPESEKLSTLRKTAEDISVNHTRILKELKEEKQIKYDSRIRLLNTIQNTVSMGEAAFEVYSKIKNEQSKIKAVVKQIDQANEKIKKINEYEQSIYDILIPLIQKLSSISTGNNFDGQSHAALDIKKWKIKDAILDLQSQILDMTEGFNAQDQFKRLIDKINYGIQTMIQMYDRIQDDMDRKTLATYIADISRNNKITNDPKINGDIDKLELVLKSNLISQEYNRAMDTFKQYMFPYAELYLAEFSVMYEYNNLTDLIDKSRVQIKSLREKMIRLTTSLHSESQSNLRIDLVKLPEVLSTVEPYYTWKHDLYRDQISKLLQGQEITVRSNTEQLGKRHAVMFNDIGVYFKIENLTLQAEFNKLISNLHINMTHLGDSYYRCGNKTFIMSQPPQTFEHSVMPNSNMKFESGNSVYKILTENPAILSPFTMWKLNLFNPGTFNFDRFTKYTNESIDLQLVGTGRYVYPEPAECNSNLEKYYKLAFTT